MLLHYLGKLKIQIFCRYSADMEENANHLQLITPLLNFNSSTHITVYEYHMLIVNKHCNDVCCDEFSVPVPQIDRKSKKSKRTVTRKILFAISVGKDSLFKQRKYQNLWVNNKVRCDKNAICLHFLPHLQKI